MDEFDKLIYNDEPIFSDYGTDEDNSHEKGSKPQRRPGFSIAAFTIGLGLNSNTMIKYTIIGTELQNIIRVSLKMVRNLRSHT
ncbi:Tm1 [Bugula neritina]|uniref:Tm1 n=1 Tax=Bugula neritina TaxID=10212 RepID=A0A7J7IV18_BUGNE|nr:Tm1 [Bugula neritina]